MAVVPPDELRSDLNGRVRRVTSTPGQSIGAYVAWNGRHFGLAWSDDTDGRHEIYFQPFEADGTPAREPQRLTIGTGMSGVGARKPPTRRATVGVLAIVTAAGARSRREGITVSLSVH